MKNKTLLLGAIAVMLLATSGTLFAVPVHSIFGTFVNSAGVPDGSKLVLNINYKVTNDEDSGIKGYWALDDYNKKVQVWQVPDGSFYAVVRYEGKWQTFATALSPEAGVSQSNDASGTFEGGYVATFNGAFTPGNQKTNGFIGSFDFGGTKADLLLRTYGAGQTGPTPTFSYLKAYFSGATIFVQTNWGWTYHYKSQTWNNFQSGNSGDIVV